MISELTRLLLSTDGADHESPVDSLFFFLIFGIFLWFVLRPKSSVQDVWSYSTKQKKSSVELYLKSKRILKW